MSIFFCKNDDDGKRQRDIRRQRRQREKREERERYSKMLLPFEAIDREKKYLQNDVGRDKKVS